MHAIDNATVLVALPAIPLLNCRDSPFIALTSVLRAGYDATSLYR